MTDAELETLALSYENAVNRNHEALAKLQLLKDFEQSHHSHTSRNQNGSKEQSFAHHIENIRLEKQHTRLQVLSNYTDRSQQLVADDNIFESIPQLSMRSSSDRPDNSHDIHSTHLQLDDLLQVMSKLTTDLELAVVKAKQQLKQEQTLLEDIQRQATKPSEQSHDTKLRALQATRDELQGWIEDSLARCEQPNDNPILKNGLDNSMTTSNEDKQPQIDQEYEIHLQKRKHLIQSLKSLEYTISTLPQPRGQSSTSPIDKQSRHLRPAPQPRHSSRFTVHSNIPKKHTLTEIQSSLLPQYRREKLLSSYYTYLVNETQRQDADLLANLNRLEHESHLLTSHPYPEHMPSTSSDPQNRHQAEITKFLQAWSFASSAADELQNANVEKQSTEAMSALEEARLEIKEMVAMQELREKVLPPKK